MTHSIQQKKQWAGIERRGLIIKMGKKNPKKPVPSAPAPTNEEEEPPASKKAKLEDDKVEKSPDKDDGK